MLPTINELIAQPATLHTVENFDPANYLTCYTNAEGTNVYYLEVKYRILWFRLCYPLGRIQVTLLQNDADQIIAEARVYTDMTMPDDHFIGQAIAHKYKATAMTEGYDLVEWTCTAAVGRALGVAGFGQQFCDILPSFEPEQVDSPTALLTASEPVAATDQGQAETIQTSDQPDKKKTRSQKKKTPTEQPPVQPQQAVTNEPSASDVIGDWDRDMDMSEEIDFGEPVSGVASAVQQPPNEPTNAQTSAHQPSAKGQPSEQPSQAVGQQHVQQTVAQKSPTPSVKQTPTSLEEALQTLSPQECLGLVINFGFNRGKSLGELYHSGDKKSLNWLANEYKGRDFTIKAGARILLSQMQRAS